MVGIKSYNFISLYRSPSQTKDELEKFIKVFEVSLENI